MPMDAKKYIEIEDQYGANNYHPLDVVINKGEGVWVYDVEGKKYVDFLSAYSAVNQGHCHPRLVETMREQAGTLTLTSRAFRNDKLGDFLKAVANLSEMDMVLPMNSGAEAVESAIKAARKWGYTVKGVEKDKAEIIVCDNNFHGRTTTIISFTTEEQYKDGFGPLTPGFKTIPYNDSSALKNAINENTVAFMVEPIQGEGGIIVPDDGYLKACQDLCRENNVLLIMDEIQTGLGRTGKMFAYQHESGVKPDVLILGKALSGGMYPVSCVASKKEVLGVFNPGDHGSTFGGNPLGASIAVTALSILKDENLVAHSEEMGTYFREALRNTGSKYIKEVRGKGLLIGVELTDEARGARRFCEALEEEGLLCKETHDNVIRFAPPLVIDKKTIDWAMERIQKVLTTL